MNESATKTICITIAASIGFALCGYSFWYFTDNIHLGYFSLPLDKGLVWDQNSASYKESIIKDNGYIVVIKNSGHDTKTTECNINNISNPRDSILTYNYGTHDKILKNEKANGFKKNNAIKVESLQVSRFTQLPLIFTGDTIDVKTAPGVTHLTHSVSSVSIYTAFEKRLYAIAFLLIGFIFGAYFFPHIKFIWNGIKILIDNLKEAIESTNVQNRRSVQ